MPRIVRPTPEEDARITRAALADPDNPIWPDEMFARAKRGRPALPPDVRRRKVTVTLGANVLDKIDAAASASGQSRSAYLEAIVMQMHPDAFLPEPEAKPRAKGRKNPTPPRARRAS